MDALFASQTDLFKNFKQIMYSPTCSFPTGNKSNSKLLSMAYSLCISWLPLPTSLSPFHSIVFLPFQAPDPSTPFWFSNLPNLFLPYRFAVVVPYSWSTLPPGLCKAGSFFFYLHLKCPLLSGGHSTYSNPHSCITPDHITSFSFHHSIYHYFLICSFVSSHSLIPLFLQ